MIISIYARKWGTSQKLQIDKTTGGWRIHYDPLGIGWTECDRTGAPALYKALDREGVNYPGSLPVYMKCLWEKASNTPLPDATVQTNLDMLSAWVQATESATPRGVFDGCR